MTSTMLTPAVLMTATSSSGTKQQVSGNPPTAAPSQRTPADLVNDGENGTDPFITEAEVNNILAGNKPDGTPDYLAIPVI